MISASRTAFHGKQCNVSAAARNCVLAEEHSLPVAARMTAFMIAGIEPLKVIVGGFAGFAALIGIAGRAELVELVRRVEVTDPAAFA